ncbi:Golgi apparatus membrane protein-like protein ECHIDNA, partial [Mucuna pruriens]
MFNNCHKITFGISTQVGKGTSEIPPRYKIWYALTPSSVNCDYLQALFLLFQPLTWIPVSLWVKTTPIPGLASFMSSSRFCLFNCALTISSYAAALAFYILSALFIDNFVIIFVVTVLLAALDFWVVKNVSGRILVGLRWWNEIDDLGESVWKFECLDHESLARMNKKDSWLFWWTLYLTAVAWIVLAIFSLIRLQADYLLVVGVCVTLSIANIVGFTKCNKDAKKQIQQFASQTIASRFTSTLQSAFTVV